MIKMIFVAPALLVAMSGVAPALLVAMSGVALAAVDRSTGLPVESRAQIYTRCGIDLTNPTAIAQAAGESCNTVGVYATLQPREQPRDND